MLLALPDIPLRTASFALNDRWLLWSEARLYTDRLVLSGWSFWKRYWRRVPFDAIEQVEREGTCLTLQLETDDDLSFRLKNAERWATALQMHRDVYERGT